MSDQKKQTRQEFERGIILKAWKDPKYKARLLKEPKKVLQEELSKLDKNIKLPDDLEIKVLEENPKTLYLTLPVNPNEAFGKELSEEDMENVAGGTGIISISSVVQTNTQVNIFAVVLIPYNPIENINAQINIV